MDFIQSATGWVKGDLLQGRVMLFVGALLLLSAIVILRGDHSILKGTLVPLGLALVILLGYGSFLSFTRAGHLEQVESLYQQNPKEAIQQEYTKAMKDNKAYSTLKPIWLLLIIVSALLYYFLKSDYLKGLSVGLLALFLIVLLVDVMLHHRLKPYLETLQKLIEQ